MSPVEENLELFLCIAKKKLVSLFKFNEFQKRFLEFCFANKIGISFMFCFNL